VTHATRTRADHLGPERRRPQVLDAALELAAEAGVANVTMGAIADRLGVTRPVVYACYASRGDVLAALLHRESRRALEGVLDTLPPRRTGSVEQMFVDGFRAVLTLVEQHPASWRIIFARDPDPALVEAIAAGRKQVAQQVGAVMRPLFERWRIDDLERALPVLVEVFLAIGEAAVDLLLDPSQDWTPESLADLVGPAAYRALGASGVRSSSPHPT